MSDLELIGKYEPNVVKAAWNIFGPSYEYRAKYVEYKAKRIEDEKKHAAVMAGILPGQLDLFEGDAYAEAQP